MSERSGSFFRRAVLVVAALAVVGALAGCDAKTPGVGAKLASVSAKSVSKSTPPTASERAAIASVNRFRSAHGLRALAVNSNLSDKAKLWAAWMAGGHCGRAANGAPAICHSSLPSGITVRWSLLAENVGAASPKTNLSGVLNGFEHSPAHAANMLNTKVTTIGVGVSSAGNTVYVAEEFMAQ